MSKLNAMAPSPASGETVALLSEGLTKSYGATVALESADIALKAGEVHALLGENGAGKSTLVKIITGAVTANRGRMLLHGTPFAPTSINEARSFGVATAFQELSLIPNLSVAQNLLLPRLPKTAGGLVSHRETIRQATDVLAQYELSRIDPSAEMASVPMADRQRLEIVRALKNAERVLVLDEPTAALAETGWLFGEIAKVTAKGVAVLYISHRLAEVREICQSATVLRNGRTIATVSLKDASDDNIFEMMVGRPVSHQRPARRLATALRPAPRIDVEDLSGSMLGGVSFGIEPGEIVGVAALEGQGQRSLFRILCGLQSPSSGTIRIDGKTRSYSSPRQALKAGSGIAYLPEERKTEGILAGLTAATNVVLPVLPRLSAAGVIARGAEPRLAKEEAAKVDMNERYLSFAIGDLSGGNQQKALIARTFASGAQTLLLFDPTRGVDVGTKQSIYSAIRAFAQEGGAVLFYSSELPEIVQLADRCLVLYQGKVVKTFEGDAIVERQIVAAMIGHGEEPRRASR
ncbi:sugar ABC transporter ATP-binding protein [Neorhizobium sp. P12A]|uniref:sugar ABC transporter ATP-binding protein n=1 Tax=Neorhizobium sp. P12A TaxID=2268027 RepID=UPI001FEDDB32|nr:sugar ABC transporter ATP-binding protein [Neorhizobium sp. P12A]